MLSLRARALLFKTMAKPRLRRLAWKLGILRLKSMLNFKLRKLKCSALYSRIRCGRSFPMWKSLEVEIHSHCNRDCGWCPRFNDRSGVRKDESGRSVRIPMPTEKFHEIIDQAAELGYRGRVSLHRLSEALLDRRFVDLARYVKSKGMKVIEDTNGDVLRKNDMLCSELDGVVHCFNVGLYDYETEEEKRRKMGFWLQRFKKTRITFSLPLEQAFIRQGSELYADSRITKVDAALDVECFMPVGKFLIRYDGEVSFCCEDDSCSFRIGNAFEHSLEEIWWSPRRIQLARQLLEPGGRRAIDYCNTCYNCQGVEYRVRYPNAGKQTAPAPGG